MNIVRDALLRRKAELEKQRVEKTIELRKVLDEEVDAVGKHARGEALIDLQAIIAHRTYLEKDLSENEMLIDSLELTLAEMPIDDSETLAAAKEAVFLAKFEELRDDVLFKCLPELHRAFVLFYLAGKLSQWPDFLFKILQFRQPNKDEWHNLLSDLQKNILE